MTVQALVLIKTSFAGDTEQTQVSLYDLRTDQSTPLAANTSQYLCAP